MTVAELTPVERIERNPTLWSLACLAPYMRDPVTLAPRDFAPHHQQLLEWIWQVDIGHVPVVNGVRCSAFVAIWGRGGAKTTLMQMCVAAVAARKRRRYVLIVCAVQDKADEKVSDLGNMLTTPTFRRFYPQVGARRINAYGKGQWKRNRIQTASGLTIDGIGLDAHARGSKVDEGRPDMIIFDDIDDTHDTAYETQKKVETITKSILLAGQTGNTVVIFVQNLILADGVAAKLVGDADWLSDRIVSGPIPALDGMEVVPEEKPNGRMGWRITQGRPTWPGQPLSEIQAILDEAGLEAFRVEAQHDIRAASPLIFPHFRPELHRWKRTRQSVDSDGLSVLAPDLPRFVAFVGGLDWGGEGATAHWSAGAVLGVRFDPRVAGPPAPFDHTRPVWPDGLRLVLVDEFKERGVVIGRRQLDWMRDMERKWGRIRWRGDGSQERAADWARELGVDATSGDRLQNSAETRRTMMAEALLPDGVDPRLEPEAWPADAEPRFMYVARCQEFPAEIQRYRRKVPRSDDEVSRREVLKINDDLIDAIMQAIEEALAGGWRTAADAVIASGVRY